MSNFFKATWQWRLAIGKCALYVFIGMGTIWCTTVQSWDSEFIATLKWNDWSILIVAMLTGACKDIISFIDKTFGTEGARIKQENIDNK